MHFYCRTFVSYPEWVFIQVRRFSLNHLYRHDAQRPDIHLWAVSLPGHHLRCHPVGRAHHRAALVLLRSDLGTESKVGCRGRRRERREGVVWIYLKSGDLWIHTSHSNQDLLSLTDPSIPSRILSLFMSLWITWLECKKSRAWRH